MQEKKKYWRKKPVYCIYKFETKNLYIAITVNNTTLNL